MDFFTIVCKSRRFGPSSPQGHLNWARKPKNPFPHGPIRPNTSPTRTFRGLRGGSVSTTVAASFPILFPPNYLLANPSASRRSGGRSSSLRRRRRGGDVVPSAASALGVGGGPGHPRGGGAPRHHPLRPRLGRDLHAGLLYLSTPPPLLLILPIVTGSPSPLGSSSICLCWQVDSRRCLWPLVWLNRRLGMLRWG